MPEKNQHRPEPMRSMRVCFESYFYFIFHFVIRCVLDLCSIHIQNKSLHLNVNFSMKSMDSLFQYAQYIYFFLAMFSFFIFWEKKTELYYYSLIFMRGSQCWFFCSVFFAFRHWFAITQWFIQFYGNRSCFQTKEGKWKPSFPKWKKNEKSLLLAFP